MRTPCNYPVYFTFVFIHSDLKEDPAPRTIIFFSIKYLYAYMGAKAIKSDCRRCLHERPGEEPAYESREHTFHDCPTVRALRTQTLSWFSELCPTMDLRNDPNQLILGWPEVEKVPPIVIHIHSCVTHAIWRTYCQLGDKEKLYHNQLQIMAVHAIKSRAKFKDQERRDKVTTPVEHRVLEAVGDEYYERMRQEWHHLPHIMMQRDGVAFGELWSEPEAQEKPAAAGADQ
ncbi:hypothetical protein BC939DRAFT_491045 [Gamsiella multidivaricata]|uniref:uncharacterized protein n=1 Tax=Gamsiella multidivaricata TaxID=101098 RepID=UPI00221FAC06|nr:uncharacterized protein BC939DRAFT_491045 [Gamsiella multidivaricata]KAI7827954.1 hypothetical protein BC939DRAFT_491045 [Gamsiella multidivaricata]